MSTNGGTNGEGNDMTNGYTNGYGDATTNGHRLNGYDADRLPPPSRPSSPDTSITPRVLLGARHAEAPSRQEVLHSIPTSQPPFFTGGFNSYTYGPAPIRESVQAMFSPASRTINGAAPSTPVSVSSRHLQVPGADSRTAVTLHGLQLSSCSDNMLVPTPYNTPTATPRTSGRSSVSSTGAPPNTPTTPKMSPRGSATTSPASTNGRRLPPAVFGSPLHPTRQFGGGPKKKQKGKLTNGKGKGKGSVKEKMLDDPALAVAHGDSPVYSENITAILQHPEAVAILSSAPDVNAGGIAELLSSGSANNAIAEFVTNGKNGFNDPGWLEEALDASARREAGDFNDMLEAKFEENWAEEDEDALDELA
ncbi:hypothetical protein VTL71DRAFT_15824 [Oculimacula yallundae]|uniref:ASX DEUBAD domain-containing protein n=1 Tax=Oculimacula yallundae TaxID=86028 RepID=A0ABR4CCS8_9HELO